MLKHYKEFDFIWASPPCQSHSRIRLCGALKGQYDPVFPDMKLYQEIIFLQNFAKVLWVIENVIPYYPPLIPQTTKIGRHLFWSNFHIPHPGKTENRKAHADIAGHENIYGFDLSGYKIKNKKQILRNCVSPELGLHILECAVEKSRELRTENLRLF